MTDRRVAHTRDRNLAATFAAPFLSLFLGDLAMALFELAVRLAGLGRVTLASLATRAFAAFRLRSAPRNRAAFAALLAPFRRTTRNAAHGLSTAPFATFDASALGKPSVFQAADLRLVLVTLSFGHDRFLFLFCCAEMNRFGSITATSLVVNYVAGEGISCSPKSP